MRALIRSPFSAAVVGGLVVAIAFLALGITGRRVTDTVIEQSPIGGSGTKSSTLTPHAIYERDAPGVVFVKALVVQQVEDPFDLFTVKEQSSSTGSGFLINTRGYILTNYHLVAGTDPGSGVSVQFENNITRPATVLDEDQGNDLALLKVDMRGVPTVKPLALGDSASVRVGDPTLAIGNPFGYDRTLSSGIVSALQSQIQAPNGFSIDNVIQTDAPINPGNSGGPLLDADGRVIGINSQIATGDDGDGSVGIAFAVPIDTAKEFLPILAHEAKTQLTILGSSGAAVAASPDGVVIQQIPTGGPAAAAGLREGDAITAIDGRGVDSVAEAQELVSEARPGRPLTVQIKRAGRTHTFDIKLRHRERTP